MLVEDNLFLRSGTYAIHFYPDAQNTIVRHNVMVDNGGGVIFAGMEGLASNNNLVTQNVITGSARHPGIHAWWHQAVGSGNVARSNCLLNSYTNVDISAGGFTAQNNIIANPGFRDPSHGDYRLPANSPCLTVVGYDTAAKLRGEPAQPAPPPTPEPDRRADDDGRPHRDAGEHAGADEHRVGHDDRRPPPPARLPTATATPVRTPDADTVSEPFADAGRHLHPTDRSRRQRRRRPPVSRWSPRRPTLTSSRSRRPRSSSTTPPSPPAVAPCHAPPRRLQAALAALQAALDAARSRPARSGTLPCGSSSL